MNPDNLVIPPMSQCMYTSCYCEENVWKLCEHVRDNQKELLPQCFVVFISNRNESIPLWCQRSGEENNNHLVIWDYHVIFLYIASDGKTLVYDLDSTLGFPVGFQVYKERAIGNDPLLAPQLRRMFRVVRARDFLETFASDRSRMKRPDGSWIMPPPPYPCMTTADCTNNLDDFMSMDSTRGIGEVLNYEQFSSMFL